MSFRYVEEANGLSGLDRPPILAIAIGGAVGLVVSSGWPVRWVVRLTARLRPGTV